MVLDGILASVCHCRPASRHAYSSEELVACNRKPAGYVQTSSFLRKGRIGASSGAELPRIKPGKNAKCQPFLHAFFASHAAGPRGDGPVARVVDQETARQANDVGDWNVGGPLTRSTNASTAHDRWHGRLTLRVTKAWGYRLRMRMFLNSAHIGLPWCNCSPITPLESAFSGCRSVKSNTNRPFR